MTDEIHHPHDKLFKTGFRDPATAAAFLREEVPLAVAARIGWSKLRPESGSYIDSHYRETESDLLFSAPLGDRECHIYLLFEHQTTRQPFMALRLLRYMIRIWEKFLTDHPNAEKLPVILPVVLAQNAEVWDIHTRFSALLEIPEDLATDLLQFVPDFVFRLFQLADKNFTELHGNASGMLILRTMKAERLAQLLHEMVWDEELLRRVPTHILEAILRYVLAADVDKGGFESKVQNIRDAETRFSAMTLAQQYRQEGWEQGILSSRRHDVLEILEIRFGTIPAALGRNLTEIADAQELARLHRFAVQCGSLAEFTARL